MHLALWLFLAAAAPVPRFEDYPAIEQLDGSPVPPFLTLPVHRRYQTRILSGATGRPNFAGAFYAVVWGCGSGCAALAVVDGRTGVIYGPPGTRDALIATSSTENCPGVGVRPNSPLIFIDHSVMTTGVCRRSFYEWRDLRYRFIRTVEVKP